MSINSFACDVSAYQRRHQWRRRRRRLNIIHAGWPLGRDNRAAGTKRKVERGIRFDSSIALNRFRTRQLETDWIAPTTQKSKKKRLLPLPPSPHPLQREKRGRTRRTRRMEQQEKRERERKRERKKDKFSLCCPDFVQRIISISLSSTGFFLFLFFFFPLLHDHSNFIPGF